MKDLLHRDRQELQPIRREKVGEEKASDGILKEKKQFRIDEVL